MSAVIEGLMHLFRRVTALVLSLLVLQLTLAGSGYGCGGHDVSTRGPHDTMLMDGTGDMLMTPAALATPAFGTPAGIPVCDALAPNAPCSVPGTGGECQAMGPCAPLVLAGSRTAAWAFVEWKGPVVALTLGPLTRSTAPEPPPPRA